MRYMGGKVRIARVIVNTILDIVSHVDNPKKLVFYDVFTGGGNIIAAVPPSAVAGRVAIDKDYFAIEALKFLRDHPDKLYEMVKGMTKEKYKEIKEAAKKRDFSKYPPGVVGYVGYAMSFGGKWFGGLSLEGKSKDYPKNSIKWQAPLLKGVTFINSDYDAYSYKSPPQIIYCDPPYIDTTKYKFSFDFNKFYNWVREMDERGYYIFISESRMPNDFVSVWSKSIQNALGTRSGREKIRLENLFIPPKFHEKVKKFLKLS